MNTCLRFHPRLSSVPLATLLLALLFLPFSAKAAAAEGTTVVLAQWQTHGGKLKLIVPLTETLSPKQLSIIKGGFTTVSQLTLYMPRPGRESSDDDASDSNSQLMNFHQVRCSVKFDAWEETYDVARLDQSRQAALIKSFVDYGELCLKVELSDADFINRFAPKGGNFLATLVVKQTSLEEAGKIKEWLIQQQSGMMQSLFSHMLGELTLSQTTNVRISVPPHALPLKGALPTPGHGVGQTPSPSPTANTLEQPVVITPMVPINGNGKG